MRIINDAYTASSNLSLWFKLQDDSILTLSDISALIPIRWHYIRDNWEFIKQDLIDSIPDYRSPALLQKHIKDMSDFIEAQRNNSRTSVNPFDSSENQIRFYAVFDTITISSLELTREEQAIVDNTTGKISKYSRANFEEIRRILQKARDNISDTVGAVDEEYNNTFDRSSSTSTRAIRIRDVNDMMQIQEAIKACDFVLANSFALDTVSVDRFSLARQNSNNSDLNIETGKSGYLVRMSFGDTLESLAKRYLGDEDRWLEIAISNGLKPPYIDEIGTFIPLIANGKDSQINISSTGPDQVSNKERFYIGQTIFLKSETVKFAEQRQITGIKIIPVTQDIILELDGEQDLNKYKINENATLQVFKPNTINSLFYVTIPTGQSIDNSASKEVPYFLKPKSEDERRAGIDFKLDDDMDLSFTSSGDFNLSYGLENAIQAVKLKMVTEQGRLFKHDEFGLINTLGETNNSIGAAQAKLSQSITQMVNVDPRFDRVEQLSIAPIEAETVESASGFVVRLVVRLAGTGTLLPINFTVNVG